MRELIGASVSRRSKVTTSSVPAPSGTCLRTVLEGGCVQLVRGGQRQRPVPDNPSCAKTGAVRALPIGTGKDMTGTMGKEGAISLGPAAFGVLFGAGVWPEHLA